MSFQIIGIIGAGTMGSGIATSLAKVGRSVFLHDSTLEAAQKGRNQAVKFYNKAVEKGKMTEAEANEAAARITAIDRLDALEHCDLVIEAIFEEFEIKKNLLHQLDPVIASNVVVATNTSALTVSGLAEHISHPERFLGLHYFNPAAVNPIVEVVKGKQTETALYDQVVAFVKETGKTPIACLDSYGFAINRFFVPYGNEAMRLLEEGIGTIPQIDRVANDVLKVAAGPFMVMNLVKPKIMYHAQCNLAPHGAFYKVASNLAEIGDQDHNFNLEDDAPQSSDHDQQIADRLQMACFFPILQSLDEGVASPQAIDDGAKLALKFGIGPCALMDQLGKDAVTKLLAPVAEHYGQALPKSLDRVGSLLSA